MDERMIPVIGACVLAAAYALHGGWLAKRWGVDPTRKTPAALGMPGHGRRRGAAAPILGCIAAGLLLAIWLYLVVWDALVDDGYGDITGVGTVALCAVLCAWCGFAALFACVRKDADLPQIAGEELFPAAGKMLYALTVLAMIALSGCTIMLSFTDERGSGYLMGILYGAAGWIALCIASASQRVAPAMGSEQQMKGASYGSAIVTGLLAIAWCSAEMLGATGESLVWGVSSIAMLLAGWLYPACLGADAIRGLLKSPLPKKKKVPDILWTLLCVAAAFALGYVGGEWLLILSYCASAAYVLLAVIVCMKWFKHIGRGFFSRN